jgi:radical SAM superfamily enzyme YgiQ (UPF0313 family)
MRVLLISSNTERVNMLTIPLGLGLVAAATRRAGHEVTFLDLLHEADPEAVIRRTIATTRPEVIGISVRNIDDQVRESPRFLLEQVKPVVAACRASSQAPLVLGGAGFSIFPEATLSYLGAEAGIAGEGEVVFPALLERLSSGADPSDLPGVAVAGRPLGPERSLAEELDALPFWDDALGSTLDPATPDLWIPVQSRRGCPNDCSYCATATIQGKSIRCRSPRQVVEGVAALARQGFSRFYFVDNSFNIPERQAFEICRLIQALVPGVAWRCILYPHLVSKELVLALAQAGCVEVALGFESGSERVLAEMNKRFTPADVAATSGLLAAAGIRRAGFLLLGGPGETRETVEESLAFARSLDLDFLKITVGIRIYPGTRLAARAVHDGVISAGDDLLTPRFYLAPGLEEWIGERVASFLAEPSAGAGGAGRGAARGCGAA